MRIKQLILLASLLYRVAWSDDFQDKGSSVEGSELEAQKTISDVNILLPNSLCSSQAANECGRVAYDLAATNGCYEWKLSPQSLIQMQESEDDQGCSNTVTLQSDSSKQSNTSVWITAHDRSSGQTFRSEAKVAQVHSLQIHVRYNYLYVNNNVRLVIKGLDGDGNHFNSMHGFKFDWIIDEGKDIVKAVQTPGVGKKEASRTDVLFLRGIEQGHVTVLVKILEPGYENVPMAKVNLHVRDPFAIVPDSPVYVLPGSTYQFALSKLILSDTSPIIREKIDLNKVKYYDWNLNSPDLQQKKPSDQGLKSNTTKTSTPLGKISQQGLFTGNLIPGVGEIDVSDSRMEKNSVQTQIIVASPFKLDIQIIDITSDQALLDALIGSSDDSQMRLYMDNLSQLPQELTKDDAYILVEEHFYVLQMSLYDQYDNRIHLTDNVKFSSKSENLEAQISMIKSDKIGSLVVFKTKKMQQRNKVSVKYALQEVKSVTGEHFKFADSPRLSLERQLVLTKPIQIQHPTDLVLLPYLGGRNNQQSQEDWTMNAEGGSGIYTWSINNKDVADISDSVYLRSKNVGKSVLTVRDHQNRANFATISVEVAPVHQLKWLEDQVEISISSEKGDLRLLSLIAQDEMGRRFTNCTSLGVELETKGDGLKLKGQKSTYSSIQEFLAQKQNKQLLSLVQNFNENQDALLQDDLQGFPKMSHEEMVHNNFGICSQESIQGVSEGLVRVRAKVQLTDPMNQKGTHLESEFAEIVVFNSLSHLAPSYAPFVADLYSKDQLGQSYQNFNVFYEDYQGYTLQTGTSQVWKVRGGSNYWQENPHNYKAQFDIQKLNEEQGQINLSIEQIYEKIGEFHFKFECLWPSSFSDTALSHKYQVNLKQKSATTRSLLQPVEHNLSLLVNCDPPTSTKLLWSQASKSSRPGEIVSLPRSRVENNTRTHFVLTNSKHYLRTMVFGDNQQLSLNHSSVATEVYVSDPQSAQIDLFNGTTEFDLNSYDKREIQFFDNVGPLQVSSVAKSYYSNIGTQNIPIEQGSGFFGSLMGGSNKAAYNKIQAMGDFKSQFNQGNYALQTEVSETMNLIVCKNVDVTPKFKSLYVGASSQDFKLNIQHGTGHFSVTFNDTNLIKDQKHHGRIVSFKPQAPGTVEVKIEDIELPDSEPVVAEIVISEIDRLTMFAPQTLLEEGDFIELTISAFDALGVEFDQDQYNFMKFSIEAELTGVPHENGLSIIQNSESNRNFNAQGNTQGIYQVTAFTNRYNAKSHQGGVSRSRSIVTEMMRLEVFPFLEIHPAELLITPNMRYTLQLVGGPTKASQQQQSSDGSHIEIRFDIKESDIATVDSMREVTGHRVGDAQLQYEIIQLRTSQYQNGGSEGSSSRLVSKKTVPIRVRLPTGVEIPHSHLRQVYSQSYFKAVAVLKHQFETFNHGIAPISYNWETASSQVLSLHEPSKEYLAERHGIASNMVMASTKIRNNQLNDDSAQFYSSFNSSSIYLAAAGKTGDGQLSVHIAMNFPNEYRYESNWFTTSVTIKVMERLAIQVPEYSMQPQHNTHLYMLPPNTQTKLQTNTAETQLRLGYQPQGQEESQTGPLISIIDSTNIRTHDKYGKATVLVEEGNGFSDQIVMLNVLISDIFSLSVMEQYDALSMPLGTSLEVPIHFQNEHAHMFAKDIEGLGVGVTLSHPRVVTVKLGEFNQSLLLESHGSGECNIKVYLLSHPQIFDVFHVKVSSVVRPSSPVSLHVGGFVDYHVQKSSTDSEKTSWTSSNPNIIKIESVSGKAIAKSTGRAEIFLNTYSSAASIVYVSEVQHAQIEQNVPLVLKIDNTKTRVPELRVRIKLFLEETENQEHELMPTVAYDGLTLIRNNAGIRCNSDNPAYVTAYGEVSEFEGFYCVVKYIETVSHEQKKVQPRAVTVSVEAFSDTGLSKYSRKVTSFEVELTSAVLVEKKQASGVSISKEKREESISLFSSHNFQVHIEYANKEDEHTVKYMLAKEKSDSNEYSLKVSVPKHVSHSFDANIVMDHNYAQQVTILPLHFNADSEKLVRPQVKIAADQTPTYSPDQGNFWSKVQSYLLVLAVTALSTSWICMNVFQADPIVKMSQFGAWTKGKLLESLDYLKSMLQGRPNANNQAPQVQQPQGNVQNGVRQAQAFDAQRRPIGARRNMNPYV